MPPVAAALALSPQGGSLASMDLKRIVTYGGGYPFAVVATCVAVAMLVPFRTLLATPVFMLLLVPVIILVARVSGVRASATAAVLAFLLLDFLFIPPYYRLTVAQSPSGSGSSSSWSSRWSPVSRPAQLRQREQAAMRRQRELELLNRLSFSIASEKSAEATAELVVTTGRRGSRRDAESRSTCVDPMQVERAAASRPRARCRRRPARRRSSPGCCEPARASGCQRVAKPTVGPAARLGRRRRGDPGSHGRGDLPAAADLDESRGRARHRPSTHTRSRAMMTPVCSRRSPILRRPRSSVSDSRRTPRTRRRFARPIDSSRRWSARCRTNSRRRWLPRRRA